MCCSTTIFVIILVPSIVRCTAHSLPKPLSRHHTMGSNNSKHDNNNDNNGEDNELELQPIGFWALAELMLAIGMHSETDRIYSFYFNFFEYIDWHGTVFPRQLFSFKNSLFDRACATSHSIVLSERSLNFTTRPVSCLDGDEMWLVYASVLLHTDHANTIPVEYDHCTLVYAVPFTRHGWYAMLGEFYSFFVSSANGEIECMCSFVEWGPTSFGLLIDPTSSFFLILHYMQRIVMSHATSLHGEDLLVPFHCSQLA